MLLTGDPGDILLRGREGEEGEIGTERAEVVQPPGTAGRSAEHLVGRQPPEEDADMGDVEPAPAAPDPAHLGRVRQTAKRRPQEIEGVSIPQIRRAAAVAYVGEVLRPRQCLEELNGMGGPPGDVAGQLLQHGRRPLPAAIGDAVGDVCPKAAPLSRGEQAGAEGVPDVGHRPLRTGLDEEIVVQLIQVLLQCPHLIRNHPEQLQKRLPAFAVAYAVDGGQQGIEGLIIEVHASSPHSIGL
ncbi:hypothetical protein ASZ90_011087 [hydrocarbon metagenome]|uniref:Uncharacterized protein n=1 Tax=hydrocarbon metagenome TaxID=938273 RepID=A0A0W8FE80_9ZZZZ